MIKLINKSYHKSCEQDALLQSSERNAFPIVFIHKLSPNFSINRFGNRLDMLDPTSFPPKEGYH